MGNRTNGNWIGAERRPAADGDRFELQAVAGGAQPLGSWPRSRSLDLRDALEAAQGASAWAATPVGERCEVVARALDLLADDPDPDGISARATGLDAGELDEHMDALWTRLDGAADEDPWRGSRNPILCAPHWSEFFSGYADAILALEDGHTVCLVSSLPLPALADRLAETLQTAGVTPGAFNVLHDDQSGALRCASELAASGPVGGFCLSGPIDPPVAPVQSRTGRALPRKDLHFGAGLQSRVASENKPRREFRRLSRGAAFVGLDEDIEVAAERILQRGLGRPVLGGQLPGQAGLVTCDPRVFSRFTEALLMRLDTPEWAQKGLYCDPDVVRELLLARELGLDEGATLIAESGPWAGGSSPSESAGGSLGWLVFTNVEPTMRLAGLTRPAPMLLLMRGEA